MEITKINISNNNKGWDEGVVGDVIKKFKLVQSSRKFVCRLSSIWRL